LALLQERGTTYQAEGAIWFASTRFGDDKDRVLVKSDGSYTYLLPDIAYHYSKLQRGFTKLLDLLGPDHHGYIARLQAAVTALGYPPDTLEVLIVQMVRLLRGGEQVRMSKRAGEFVTMAELLDEVGTDAARFFFLQRACESHLDFDLDLAKVQGNENPVFYVQYAHARIASILRQAKELGYNLSDDVPTASLQHPAELALLRRMADLPDEVASAALAREPHRLTYYAQDLAALFHAFYTECRVLGEEAELSQARLALTDAARIVLRNTLTLLGVTAPERM
jgi:arginyl-tRNA synthetase